MPGPLEGLKVLVGGQVDETKKRGRTGEMLELAAAAAKEFRQSALGQTRPVLWKPQKHQSAGGTEAAWTGLTDNYLRIRTRSGRNLGNSITNTRLTALDEDWVTGEVT